MGELLEIERLAEEKGASVTFDRVLALRSEEEVRLGTPTVPSATVTADVVRHRRGKKLITFKMKRRKGYHRKQGHRQELTVVQITGING